MVDLSSVLAAPAKTQKAKQPKPATLKPQPAPKPSPPVAAPGSMILAHIREQMDAAGWPADEPMRIMFESLASKQDRIEITLAAFGPDAGRMAADAARREVAAGMRKLTWNIGLWRWAVAALALFVAAGYGWIACMTFYGLFLR